MGHYASEMDDPPPRDYGMDEWQRKTNEALKGPPDPDSLAAKNNEIAELKRQLHERTIERDYHMRVADALAGRIRSDSNGTRALEDK